MPRILLTNDDGIEAPGLTSFARRLSDIGDLNVVVPDRERSWIGKAITRFDPVRTATVERDGIPITTTTGYPADCVQIGMLGQRPDIVVSGINVGYNYGAAYLQSSGTVGAALEGGIAGVPSVAFSTGSAAQPWDEWKRWAMSPDSEDTWVRLAGVAAGLVERLLALARPGVLSIGLPDDADSSTAMRITNVAQVEYDRLFAEVEPGVYLHRFGGIVDNGTDLAGTDIEAAGDGVIAVTPVEGTGFSDKGRSLAEALLGV